MAHQHGFDGDFDPVPGVPETLEPGLRRILAPNPSPMTYRGTNTYLLGDSGLAVIDPGPDDSDHFEAILAAVEPKQSISHILVSHAHLDHSPLARRLSNATGAPVYGFGDAHSGRSEIMRMLAKGGLAGGGEGIDHTFEPDIALSDGETIAGDGWRLSALHTPGHIGNHLCFSWGDACFTADHVMGWASSMVSPPDGDLTDFMASCNRLLERNWRVFYPGHGALVSDPGSRLEWLVSHRRAREAAILQTLEAAPATARGIADRVYSDVPSNLLPAAARNVLAHLVDLAVKNTVVFEGDLHEHSIFHLAKLSE